MFCKNCGAQLADDAKFCDVCGAQTSAEQADIKAQQEKSLQENPSAYFDVKTAILITVIFFVIMPGVCWYAGVPPVLGLVCVGALSTLALIMGIRNQLKNKK